MKWDDYSHRFQKVAARNNFTAGEIEELLGYAKTLYDKRLPIIYEQEHLALLLGYKYEYLLRISNSPRRFYRTFKIPKKSGGDRAIAEPLPSLKEIQRWILDEILSKQPVSRYAKAFVRKRSIRDNARFHIGQRVLLTIDVKDFFPSLNFSKVFGVFSRFGYTESVATMLSNLCCLDGQLPQGAPTSPALSNLVLINVDNRIAGFTKKHDIRYTRYADDMAFSGNFKPGMMIKFVRGVLSDIGLIPNERKYRVRVPGQRQEVTGVVVNERMRAPKEMRRDLRQSVYYVRKYGLDSHLHKTENTRANHIRRLLGIANFILFLDPSDNEVLEYKEVLRQYLPGAE